MFLSCKKEWDKLFPMKVFKKTVLKNSNDALSDAEWQPDDEVFKDSIEKELSALDYLLEALSEAEDEAEVWVWEDPWTLIIFLNL